MLALALHWCALPDCLVLYLVIAPKVIIHARSDCHIRSMRYISFCLITLGFCTFCDSALVSWSFSAAGCSGAFVDWASSTCWSNAALPSIADDVIFDPSAALASTFSVVVNSAIQIRSITVYRAMLFFLKQSLFVTGNCQYCGSVNSTGQDVSLSCNSMNSCVNVGASLFSGTSQAILHIHNAAIRNLTISAPIGKIILRDPTSCSNCTFVVARDGTIETESSISASSANQCTFTNFGILTLGSLGSNVFIYNCSIVSSSNVFVRSTVLITLPAQFSGLVRLYPSASLVLMHSVSMYSLQISPIMEDTQGTLVFRAPVFATFSIEAAIDFGIQTSFELCPASVSLLNISITDDLSWNCASTTFSSLVSSSLNAFGNSRIRFGTLTQSVQMNSIIPADVSTTYASNADLQLRAFWSNLFDMRNVAEATVASNILLAYGNPVCYRPPSLSIACFQSSSVILQSSSTLLFGVAASFFDSSYLSILSQTSFLQSIVLRSRMDLFNGSLYVRRTLIPFFVFVS